MDYRAILQVSASGMGVEKLRLDTAALNIANMETSAAPGQPGYQPLRVVSQAVTPSFGDWMRVAGAPASGGVAAAQVVDANAQPRVVHDPANPHADAHGDVRYPGIDHTHEMLQVMMALRAYEANVAALSASKAMASFALGIGGQS